MQLFGDAREVIVIEDAALDTVEDRQVDARHSIELGEGPPDRGGALAPRDELDVEDLDGALLDAIEHCYQPGAKVGVLVEGEDEEVDGTCKLFRCHDSALLVGSLWILPRADLSAGAEEDLLRSLDVSSIELPRPTNSLDNVRGPRIDFRAQRLPAVTPESSPDRDARRSGRAVASRRVLEVSTSAGGIYGLIVVSGVIVVTRNLTGSSGEALLAVVGTLLVFFAAHAYAATLGEMSRHGFSFREALKRGLAESIGMIVIGVIPILVLLLGVIGVLRPADAVWLALLIDVLLLGVLGWAVTAARLRNTWARLGGAILTAGFGGMIIALKAFIH